MLGCPGLQLEAWRAARGVYGAGTEPRARGDFRGWCGDQDCRILNTLSVRRPSRAARAYPMSRSTSRPGGAGPKYPGPPRSLSPSLDESQRRYRTST